MDLRQIRSFLWLLMNAVRSEIYIVDSFNEGLEFAMLFVHMLAYVIESLENRLVYILSAVRLCIGIRYKATNDAILR